MPIDEATREQLRTASTATIATQLFRLGLRNQFLNGLLPANAEHCRFVGEAATLRYIPMREDLDVLEAFRDPAHPQRKAIETARAGTVLVMDCRGETRAASVGNILVTRLRTRGGAGLPGDRGAAVPGLRCWPLRLDRPQRAPRRRFRRADRLRWRGRLSR